MCFQSVLKVFLCSVLHKVRKTSRNVETFTEIVTIHIFIAQCVLLSSEMALVIFMSPSKQLPCSLKHDHMLLHMKGSKLKLVHNIIFLHHFVLTDK
jgi:hypothetical protein